MRKRTWLWLAGGAGLAWLLWPKSKTETKPGDLAISVYNFKAGVESQLQQAIATANSLCSGLPPITDASKAPTTSGGPDSRTLQMVVTAQWSHDTLGPVKEAVRACLEKGLQAVAPGASVTATRIS